MIVHYFDPSAWLKRHVREQGTEAVGALMEGPIKAATSGLAIVEMCGAIARRSESFVGGEPEIRRILRDIHADFARFRVVDVDERRLVEAADLAFRHRLRALDAVHLASAMSLRNVGEMVMVSADRELLSAAKAEGMETLDPA